MAIRAVIFDYGMVLSLPQEQRYLQHLLDVTGLSRETFESYYWTHRHAYDMGTFNGTGYWNRFASEAGIELSKDDIDRLIENDVLMWCTLNESMLGWAKSLADRGLRIGILSNMGEETLTYIRQEFAWLGDFHHHTFSCELGIAKPDPAIYTHTCEKLGVLPAEALFLDDKIENVVAARRVGLYSLQFTNVENLKKQLEESPEFAAVPLPKTV